MKNPGVVVGLLLFTAVPAFGQSVTVGVYGVVATHTEVTSTNRVDGFGGAFGAAVDFGRFAVEGTGSFASVTPAENPSVTDFRMFEGQLHVRYAINDLVGAEAGYIRRVVNPEFAAQEVGAVSLGARLGTALTSVADMFVRGGFAPIAGFSGGGSAGLSYQVGFGIVVRPSSPAWALVAEYDFQRFGRSVRNVDVPIQVEIGRVGVRFNIF